MSEAIRVSGGMGSYAAVQAEAVRARLSAPLVARQRATERSRQVAVEIAAETAPKPGPRMTLVMPSAPTAKQPAARAKTPALSPGGTRRALEAIKEIVSDFYCMPIKEIVGQGRERDVVYVRQVAMYLARTTTHASLPVIGRAFGREHTTVMHSLARLETMASAPAVRRELAVLRDLVAMAVGPTSARVRRQRSATSWV